MKFARRQTGRSTCVELTVPFHDLDPMQVVWHGNYLKYFELARQRLFDDSGVDLYRVAVEDGTLFPIVKTALKYVQPLRFRDRIRVSAQVIDAQRRIVLQFEIRRLSDDQVCTRGTSEQLAVRAADQSLLFAIPAEVRDALLEKKS
jgi:acyl-CoA thioester hydrolase